LTGTTSYKIYNTGTTETVCVFNPRPTFVQNTPWQFLSAYTDCAECLFIPPSPTPTQTPSNTPTPSITPTISLTPSVTASPTPTSNPYCYTIQGSTTYYGECYFCPNTYNSFTDWFIRFFDGCNGTQIPAPLNMNVIAHYSDGSTQNTFIPAGGTGDYFIASSQVECGFPPECTEFRSPTFEYADVIPVVGTITECCTGPTPTPTSPTQTPTSQTPTPTPTPSVTPPVGEKSLVIYATDAAVTRQNVTLYYTVNYGPSFNIPGATATLLPISCSQIYTIPGLSAGDVITINTSLNCAIEGTQGFLSCPSITSYNLNYTYVIDAPSTQAISLTVDTSIIP
jgi:hypothetical protein